MSGRPPQQAGRHSRDEQNPASSPSREENHVRAARLATRLAALRDDPEAAVRGRPAVAAPPPTGAPKPAQAHPPAAVQRRPAEKELQLPRWAPGYRSPAAKAKAKQVFKDGHLIPELPIRSPLGNPPPRDEAIQGILFFEGALEHVQEELRRYRSGAQLASTVLRKMNRDDQRIHLNRCHDERSVEHRDLRKQLRTFIVPPAVDRNGVIQSIIFFEGGVTHVRQELMRFMADTPAVSPVLRGLSATDQRRHVTDCYNMRSAELDYLKTRLRIFPDPAAATDTSRGAQHARGR